MQYFKGLCAKQDVTCLLVNKHAEVVVEGHNWCANPQLFCPREEGEGYEKCTSVCEQYGHAEEVALEMIGGDASHHFAVLQGHDHYCRNCQIALFGAGVLGLTIEEPTTDAD